MVEVRVRELGRGEFEEAVRVVNEAAKAYRRVLPAEVYKEPQMTLEEFEAEAERIRFLAAEVGGRVVGVMGYEYVDDVALVRHGYVEPGWQRMGVGSRLLSEVERMVREEGRVKRLVVGMYRDAYWAVSFWSKHGFRLVEDSEKTLKKYYRIPEVQVKYSVAMWKDLEG